MASIAGDIMGIAMDLDNNKLYFHKNEFSKIVAVTTSESTANMEVLLDLDV